MLAESSTRGSILHAATSRSSKTPLEYGLELTGEVLLYRQFSLQDSGLDSVGQDFRQENVAETDHYSVGPYFRHSHRHTSVCFSDNDGSVGIIDRNPDTILSVFLPMLAVSARVSLSRTGIWSLISTPRLVRRLLRPLRGIQGGVIFSPIRFYVRDGILIFSQSQAQPFWALRGASVSLTVT